MDDAINRRTPCTQKDDDDDDDDDDDVGLIYPQMSGWHIRDKTQKRPHTYAKDPVVHVRFLWSYGNTKRTPHALKTFGLATIRQKKKRRNVCWFLA